MNDIQQRIVELKREKNALILAHFYQTVDIQQVADHVCDSFEMAKRAHDADEELLIICGVKFMAESAKILNPDKTVLIPVPDAGCPMADMVEPQDVIKLREEYPDAAVVCYVNSSAAVKAVSDICCTSSSAEKIIRSLKQKQIIFVPDQNLGMYIASKVPEKEIIIFSGFCPTHHAITENDALAVLRAYPVAKLLVHPECRPEVLKHADYIGSTAGIIKEVTESDAKEFIIGTEMGVLERLKTLVPDKSFYPMSHRFTCPNMKKTRLIDVLNSLENGEFEITLSREELEGAGRSLERMVGVK